MHQKKIYKSIVCFALSLVLIILPLNLKARAIAYPVMAVISKKQAQVWSLPGTTGHEADPDTTSVLLDTLGEGTTVRLIADQKDGDEDVWYKVEYGSSYSKSGYVYSGRVKITASYTEDPEFEAWLTSQNFPEDYKVKLRIVHTLYPKWIFYADHTGLDWNESVTAQSELGKKTVHTSWDNSLKSMQENAYDWDKNLWLGLDGSSWVAAAPRTIAYYMDPRNFLDEINIFQFADLAYDAEKNKLEYIEQAVKGTFMEGTLPDNPEKTYAQVIFDAAAEFNMSPFAMVSIFHQEQGTNGSGASISGTNSTYPGIYNYFNIGAFEGNGMDTITRGLWWANGGTNGADHTYLRPWTTHELAIRGGADWYTRDYISVGQNTIYYKDFNVGNNTSHPPHIHQYASNIADAKNEGVHLNNGYYSFKDSALVFHIPVYKNMPTETTLPPDGTNNNCYLSALTVNGESVQGFSRYTKNYDVIVPYSAQSVNIAATGDPQATIAGIGSKNLEVGLNTVVVNVASSAGDSYSYTLNIFREQGDIIVPEPEINGDYVLKNSNISGVEPQTDLATFISNLSVKNGTAKILDYQGNEKTTGYIATGDTVFVYNNNNEQKLSYSIVIYGDVTGDGKISSRDLLVLQRHILEIEIIKDEFLLAGDANRDNGVKSRDLLVIQRHILEMEEIKQQGE